MVDDETTTVAPTTDAPTTTTAAPTPPLELLGAGPHDVGVATITVDDGTERPLTVGVWFPIEASGDKPLHQYTFLPGIYYESPTAVTADLSEIDTSSTYPLVVYSHGSGGQRFIHSNYTETIASHGYIVLAPDHTGNTLFEELAGATGDPEQIVSNRPKDISNVLDAIDGTEPIPGVTDVLAASIAEAPIVITGHSLGGYTSYALASGTAIGDVLTAPDDRIEAIIALAPAASVGLLSDEQLTAIDIAQMIIVGTDDKTTPIDPNVERPWALSTGEPMFRVELLAAEHLTFTDMCSYVEFLPQLESVPAFVTESLEVRSVDGCSVGDMEVNRAQELTNTFAIGFLDMITKGASEFDPVSVVLPDDVTVQVR